MNNTIFLMNDTFEMKNTIVIDRVYFYAFGTLFK